MFELLPCRVQLNSRVDSDSLLYLRSYYSISPFIFLKSSSLTIFTLLFSSRHFSVAGYAIKTLLSRPTMFCRCFLKRISAFRRFCFFFAKSFPIPIKFQRKEFSFSLAAAVERILILSVYGKP